jgi:hypothetical protein
VPVTIKARASVTGMAQAEKKYQALELSLKILE